MVKWVDFKLSNAPLEIIDGDRGVNYPSQDELSDCGYCLFLNTRNVRVDGFNMSECQFITKERDELLRKGKLQRNDLVLTTRGTVGNLALFDSSVMYDNVRVNSGMVVIRPKKDELSPVFNYYLFRNLQSSFHVYSSGSAQPQLPIRDLKEIEVSIPSLPEQEAIASVLSSLDDKIDLLHRQNKTLEAMAETLFRQWFVVEARDEWEDGTLGEVIEIFDNQRVPLSKMERDRKKDGVLYPYYGAAQIMDYINDYIFDGDYILLGEDGTVRTNDGCPVLQYATGKFWVNNHAHVLRAKLPYSNFFVWSYLLKKNIDEIITGAVQPKISQGNLRSLAFPRFPVDKVDAFNRTTKAMLEKINTNRSQLHTLTQLRDALLPKLVSGEVRVGYEH